MSKESKAERDDDLRPEYDLSKLAGGVRGKYYRRGAGATNLVLIDADLVRMFPNSEAVNRALRAVADAAESAISSKRRRV